MFLDFLYQLQQFGKLSFKQNLGKAGRTGKSILLAYFDAGKNATQILFHMVYESHISGQFYTEYVYAANSLVPRGTNNPHSERDAAYKVSVTETFLIGDSQIALWWILNKEKKTEIYVCNRTHFIGRIFENDHILFVPTEETHNFLSKGVSEALKAK